MGEDGAKAAHLQVEQRRVEQGGRLCVRALHQEVAAATEAQRPEGRVLKLHELRHGDLPDLQVDLGVSECRSELLDALVDQLKRKRMIVSDVWSADQGLDAGGLGRASEAQCGLHAGSAVVEAGQDVAVQVDQGAALRVAPSPSQLATAPTDARRKFRPLGTLVPIKRIRNRQGEADRCG